jgi:hypothetical protein
MIYFSSLVVQIRLPSFPGVRVIVKRFVGSNATTGRVARRSRRALTLQSIPRCIAVSSVGRFAQTTGDLGIFALQSGAHIERWFLHPLCDKWVGLEDHDTCIPQSTQMLSTTGSMDCLRDQVLAGIFCLGNLDRLAICDMPWVEPFMGNLGSGTRATCLHKPISLLAFTLLF